MFVLSLSIVVFHHNVWFKKSMTPPPSSEVVEMPLIILFGQRNIIPLEVIFDMCVAHSGLHSLQGVRSSGSSPCWEWRRHCRGELLLVPGTPRICLWKTWYHLLSILFSVFLCSLFRCVAIQEDDRVGHHGTWRSWDVSTRRSGRRSYRTCHHVGQSG